MGAAWLPVLGWVGVIYWLSGDRFSDERTAEWLTGLPFLAALGLPPALVDGANLIVRKCAHFVEYAVLSILAGRALRVSVAGISAAQRLAAAVALAVAVAGADELLQSTTLTRSGSPRDVVLDGAGAVAGAMAGAALLYARSRRRLA